MTTLKKTILYLGVPVLAALITLPFWPERYGDSYSEQQRKLWNEKRALWERGILGMSYKSPPPHIEEQIKAKEQFSRSLWDSSAPDREITHQSVPPDLSKLPPGGMTLSELLHHAERHKDPDAWLSLLSFCVDLNYGEPTKLELLSMKKYVTKARELNRPGSDFLLRAIDKREETLTAERRKIDAEPQLEQLAGYKEFKELVGSGDFILFKALVTIWPGLRQTSMGFNLESVLERKARQGDIVAQRQLGEYGFLCRDALHTAIRHEKRLPRSPVILWFSKKAKEWCPDFITISQTMDSSPTRDKLNEYAAWLKKAADAGDLDAMYLWLNHGVDVLDHSSRKEWQDILRYNDILIEAGYEKGFPYMGSNFEASRIIFLHYSTENLERLMRLRTETLSKRGSQRMAYTNLWANEWAKRTKEENLKLLDEAERLFPEVLINRNNLRNYLYHIRQIEDEDVKQRYVDIIRKIASEGEPYFMAALADMIGKNIAKPSDPDEATRLLEATWLLVPKYNTAFYYDGERYVLSDLVVDHLMAIYLLERPTPENKQKAFDLAQQYLSFNNARDDEDIGKYAAHFYLSLMYQKGYVTPHDPEKEREHYRQYFETMRNEKYIKPLIEKFDYKVPQ